METGLGGKVVVVTGAGAGIGLATTRLLREEGAHVVAADANIEEYDEGVADGDLLAVKVDLGEPTGPGRVIEAAIDTFGRIDGLVNNVGVAPTRKGFLEVSDEAWVATLNMNFLSMVRATRAALPHMISQHCGAIVNLGSEVARQPDVFLVDYSVSKAAVVSWTKSLSNEFGKDGIRANVVSPGPTRTKLWDQPGGFVDYLAREFSLGREEAVDHFAREVRHLPMGRIGVPEDVASVIVFLLSERARQVTGSDYYVDSGAKKSA